MVKNNIFGIPNSFDNQTEKDTRRSFTATQKKEILAQQDFKCASCRRKLGVAYHFHHAKAWAVGGETTVKNGRAVCANCHEKISHRERLKNVEKRRPKDSNQFFSF